MEDLRLHQLISLAPKIQETATGVVLLKKVFLKILQISQSVGVSF